MDKVRITGRFNSYDVCTFLLVVAVLCTLLCMARYSGDDDPTWHTLPDAYDHAKQFRKPLFAFHTYDDCVPCERFKRNVLEHESVARLLRDRFSCAVVNIGDSTLTSFPAVVIELSNDDVIYLTSDMLNCTPQEFVKILLHALELESEL